MEKAFINKKPYVTKKGISRPGRVTVLSDDRDSAKRVRALYDWVERDKPKEQEPKRRPFEDDSIINKDALKDPKTLKAVADIFDKADRRTVVASEEGDVRVEYDVSKNGKPIPGTTRVLDNGRVMITDFAIDPKLGLDGSLSRTKKWIEGLNGGPKDTLAIYVNPETKAVRFTGRGAERVSQENGIDLEEVVPRMNREGIPVIVMIGNRANVAWPGERPSGQEAPVSAPEAKPQEVPTSTSTPAPSKPQTPAKPKKTLKGADKVDDFLKDVGLLREAPWNDNRPDEAARSRKTLHEAASRQPSAGTTPGRHQGDDGNIVAKRIEDIPGKIAFVERTRLSLLAPGISQLRVRLNGGNFIGTMAHNLGLEKRSPSSFYGRFNPTEAAERELTLRLSDHAINPRNAEKAGNTDTVSLAVFRTYASKKDLEPSSVPIREFRYSRKDLTDDTMRRILGDLSSLFRTGDYPNKSGGNPFPKQSGMLREGPASNNDQRDKIIFGLPKLLDALLAANADMRTFEDFSERLFGLLDSRGQRQAWEALKPYLQGAWLTVGNLRGELNLDEPSRADAKAVFERVERGEAAQQQETDEPAPQQAPTEEQQAEPTATPAAPTQQQPAPPEPVAQAPQAAPQPVPTDWASAKNGEIRLGEDGKAYIRWEDYWLTPATGKSRKWVGSRKRGRMETVEVEGVNVHDRLPDGKPGAQAKVFFEPDGRWVNPNNGKVHYGHMQALVDDPKNGYRWTALDRWADDGNPRADMANAREAMERGTLGAVTEPQQKEDEHERTGIQSASGQVGGAVGGQEPSRDGGDGVGGAGAGVPGRGVSVPGGVDVSSGLAGEQPAEGVSDDAAGVGGRAGKRGEDGGAVSGATLPVQLEGGDRGVRAGGDAEQSVGGDGGRGQGAAQGVQPPAEEPRPLTDDRTATANYVIPEAGNGGLDAITNARERIAANLSALRVLKALQKEGRQATVAEQRTLSLYTGWGSLGEQLFNDQNPDWAEERAELKGLLTEAEYASARRTVQYAHYTPMDVVRGMYDALGLMGVRGANLSAYEAGLGVGRFIGGLPEGLRGTRYTGVEMDPLTAAIAAQLYPQATVVNEKYQDVPAPHGQFDFIVGNPPYGNIKLSDRSFPDGNGQSLHNFFIMKQIEALRPGGVAAFLVTHYFLDAQDQSARLWIHRRAQFLGAIRMPNALFKTVDASLATDIVFFRKRLPGEVVPSVVGEKKKGKGKKRDDEETGVAAIPRESQWVYTDTVTKLGRDENNKNPDGLPLRINMAFSPNRTVYDMRAVYYSPGDAQANAWPSVVASTRYGKDRPQADLVVHGPAPTREGIYNTLTRMPIRTFLAGAFQPYTERVLSEQETREWLSTTQAAKLGGGAAHPSLLAGGHFVGADGKLYYATKGFDGQLVAWPVKPYDEAAEKAAYATNPRMTKAKKGKPAHPAPFNRWKDVRDPYTKFTPKEQGIMKTIAALREVRFDLMQEELSENADEARMTALRKRLNEAYADFQKAAQGYAGTKRRPPALNDREIKALMFADPASSQLLGLETLKKDAKGNIVEAGKSAVFFRRVNEPKWRPLEHYDKAMDALVANLSETGAIDLDWIMARTGKGREAILDELRERVYIDPETERPVLREQYLSGDVKTKWEVAKQAVAEGKTEYARNVEALGTVIPADIAIEDLYVPFGSSIVTGEMVGRFAQSEMGFVHRDDVKATFNTQTGTWEVDVKNVPKDLFGRYFVANRSFKDVMKAALNNKGLTVYEKDEQGNSHPNKEATEQVAETIRQIRDQWEMWWPSSPFAAEIGKTYNARYNRIAEAQYDGAFLKFQGLNPALTPYRHQRDAVWRTVVTGNVLYNHVVGSGKTNTAILSIMEMKRMGRVRKPVVVVPNHLVEQWRNDFLAAYPGANVLATDVSDLNAENRKRYFARIQNGDYDVIILPHSQLSRISLSPDVLKELVARQIAKYREALEELVRNGAERYTIKRIENMIERMEARIDAKIKALRTDETGIFFDTLGIDGLFLDEAHEFKNVPFVSAVQAKGMGNPSGSSKAFDLLMKVNWMRQKRAGAPVVFMTGTPVSNSLTELYLNMLYMAPDLLEKAKLNSMDAFLQSFGLVDERMEVATTGQFKVARRLRKLMNVPELMRMVRTYMDVIDADDLRGSMESVGRAYDVPELETGAPINVVAKRSPLQEIYFGKEVAKRQKADGSFEREFNVGSIYYRAGHMPQDPSEDNMLKLTNDAMAASLDIRLRKRELIAMGVPESELTDEALDFAGSKVNLCVAQIVKDYKRFDAVKGTQMVFCDRSIPGSVRKSTEKELEKKREKLETARKDAELEELDPTAGFTQRDEDEESPAEKVARLEREVRALEDELTGGGGFSVYDDIKRKLIAQGIPENEIAFIHSYNSKDQKQALFDRMNAGKVRVLLGSTSRMGAGTNANKRMVSMHHLDAPWRPSDMEQRNGRIIRQGNLLMKEIPDFKVRVYQYGTEKSADAFKFSTLLEKGRAFHGIYKRTNTTRNVEDIGEGELSSEQMMAQLSGSLLMPLMIEQREGVQTLERLARNHNAKRRNLVDARDNTDAQTPIIQDNLARARRVTELATERPDTKENYYAGIDLRDRDGNPIALNAKTMRERLDEQHGEPIAKLLHLGATIRYRGLEWVSTQRTSQTGDLFDVYEEVKAYAPGDASAERRPLVMTTQYDVNGAKDDSIIIRMNNAIDKARQSIPIFEGQLKANAEELAKLDRQLAEYPEAFPKNQELLEAKREFADIERCVNADATTAAEARVTLGHYYGQKGLPVPDYTWTRPEFDEKHGVGNSQQAGMLKEAAASVPFGELERWNRTLDNYGSGRLDPDRPVTVLRKTPEIIRAALRLAAGEQFSGQKPINIRVENLDKITGENIYTDKGKHNIPVKELRKLQFELDNPVAIFVSQTHPDTSIVIVTELVDNDGNAKAIIALKYAYHPNRDYASLIPMNANVLSSAYGKKNVGKNVELLYVNTKKASSWEAATRLQLPFPVLPSQVAGLSVVLTEKDFSMDDKGKVLKNGRLVNPEDLGRLREPKWERELREHLAREGKTEADLSPETQAYLNAKREREAVMPKGAFGQAADFLGEAVRPREGETHWEFAGFVNRPLIPSLGHCSIGTGLGGLPMALHPDALGLFAVLVARDAPMAFHPGLRRRGLLGRVGGEDAGCARRGLLGLLGRGGLHHDGLLGRRLHHHRRRLPDDGRRDWQRQPEGAMPPHARPEREDATPGADAHAPTPRGRPVPTRWGRRGPAWGPSRRPAPSHPRPARQQHHGHRQRSHAPRSFPSSHSIPFPIRPRKRASLQGEAVEGAEEVGHVDLAVVDEGGAEEGRAEVLGPEGFAGGEVGGVEATVGGGDEHAIAGADGGALDGAHGAVGVGGGEDEAFADGEAPAFLQGRAVEGDEAGVDGRQQDELLGEEGLAAVLEAEAEVFAPQHLAGAGLQLEEALAGGDPDGLAVGGGDGAAEAEVGVGLAPEEFAGGGVGGAERVPVGAEDDGAVGEGGAVGGAFAEAPAAAQPAFFAGGGVEGGEALAGAGVEGAVGEGHAADEAGEGRVGEFGLPDLGAVVGGEGVGPALGILGVDARAVGGDGVFDGGAGVGVPQFLAGGGVEGRHAALVAQVFVGDAEEEAAAAVRDGGGEEDLAADGDAPEGLGALGGGLGERGVTEVGAGGAVGGDAHEAEGADGAVDAALFRGVGAEGLDGALAAGVVEVPVAVEPGAEAVGGEVDPAVIEAFAGAEEVVAEDDQRGAGGQEGEVVAQPGGDLAGGVGGAVVATGHGEDDVVGAAGVEGIPRGAVEALEERLAVGAFHQIVVADGPEDGHAHVLEEGLVLAEAALIADVAGVDDEGGPLLPRQIPQPLGHRAVVGLLPAGHLRVRDMDEGVRPLRRGRPGGERKVVAVALRLDGDPMARHARAVGHRERDEARLGVVGGEGKTPLRVGADDVEAVGDRRARAWGLARVPLAIAV